MADAFLQAFEEIDSDCSGEISKEELQAYMKKKNYEEAFVDKWLKIFDMDHSGTISVEEFCETLGLVARPEYIKQVKTNRQMAAAEAANPMDGVRIITVDPSMPQDMREKIVKIARQAQKLYDKERDIAKYVKEQLDIEFFTSWHVGVGRFQYGSFVSHERGCLFHFWVRRFAFIVWKTPDYSSRV